MTKVKSFKAHTIEYTIEYDGKTLFVYGPSETGETGPLGVLVELLPSARSPREALLALNEDHLHKELAYAVLSSKTEAEVIASVMEVKAEMLASQFGEWISVLFNETISYGTFSGSYTFKYGPHTEVVGGDRTMMAELVKCLQNWWRYKNLTPSAGAVAYSERLINAAHWRSKAITALSAYLGCMWFMYGKNTYVHGFSELSDTELTYVLAAFERTSWDLEQARLKEIARQKAMNKKHEQEQA